MNEYATFQTEEQEVPNMLIVWDSDGIMGVCHDPESASEWADYFRQSETWKTDHQLEDHPLQSVFRSPYLSVRFKDIEGDTFGDDVFDLIDKMEEEADIYVFAVPAS